MKFDADMMAPEQAKLAKKLIAKLYALEAESSAIQKRCIHEWNPVREYDPKYSPRIAGSRPGEYMTIVRWSCAKCNASKLANPPNKNCRNCGADMRFNGMYHADEQRVNTYKCPQCKHEYEQT